MKAFELRSVFIVFVVAVTLLTTSAAHAFLSDSLIYIPGDPCRIVDTREATAGALAEKTPRNFLAYGDNGELNGQGGLGAGCPHPKEAEGLFPVAIAANVTAVPSAAGIGGWITAYPAGTTLPSTSLVNFASGQVIANSTIITLCTESCPAGGDFTLYSAQEEHALVDVTGYFYPRNAFNVITVARRGGDFNDIVIALLSIPLKGSDAPSITNKYVIEVGPGTFDVGDVTLGMREYVDIAGAGPNVTTIQASELQASGQTNAVILGANNAQLSGVNVTSTNREAGIRSSNRSPRISNVTVNVTLGLSQNGSGILLFGGGSPVLENVAVSVNNGTNTAAVLVSDGANVSMNNVQGQAQSTGNLGVGLLVSGTGTSVFVRNSLFTSDTALGFDADAAVKVVNTGLSGTISDGNTGSSQCRGTYDPADLSDINC